MSEQSDPQQGQSEEVPQPDIDQQFKEYIEELLEVEKAHLPDMPAPPKRRRPPRPEVIREFETRVRQLLNQRAGSQQGGGEGARRGRQKEDAQPAR